MLRSTHARTPAPPRMVETGNDALEAALAEERRRMRGCLEEVGV